MRERERLMPSKRKELRESCCSVRSAVVTSPLSNLSERERKVDAIRERKVDAIKKGKVDAIKQRKVDVIVERNIHHQCSGFKVDDLGVWGWGGSEGGEPLLALSLAQLPRLQLVQPPLRRLHQKREP